MARAAPGQHRVDGPYVEAPAADGPGALGRRPVEHIDRLGGVERAAAPAGERAGAVGDSDGVAGCFDCRAHRRGVNCHFGQPLVVCALVF